ncbi:heme lyase CcmF/NrfE family subunit [Providencia vermicola]|uniref:heme lyase CcmF/NrfE family subunit n=1 Tax=Providencia TaxID=586 RepID=UPI0012B5D1A6|nr:MULTISPECIES: heme lyase CcmF/NrfE family subunit [unclassified Providencia]MTB39466.1 heme lyase CcmF/NrfE family subunit [Providencia sp. wls1949]MTC06777.1 heme lyase CcmF/NrfE family subunit [Providencia sp. wls1948]
MELILPEIGFISLLLTLCIASFHTLFGLVGYDKKTPNSVKLGVFWSTLQFIFLAIAFLCLTISFIESHFSVVYVAQHSHRLSPMAIKIAAVWGGHEGSLLLWALFLSAWNLLVAWRYRKQKHPFFALALIFLSAMTAALLWFIVFYSDPFVRIFPPAIEGRDLNPMLQHWGLILHPPLLYLGYSGLMVVTSLVLAALVAGNFSQTIAWLCWRWAVPSWCILTLGITLGSWWAYSELGWGGWWFWDPVENASLLPWLAATALLHSLSASRKQGNFRHWSMMLAIMAFILSLLGTLIVRSGILVSVHAFALDNVRALPLFLLFIIMSMAALFIYSSKAQTLPSRARTTLTTREIYLQLSLILFVVVLCVVLLGTLYPMLYSMFGWGKISVGSPYFNHALFPFGLLMLAVIGAWALHYPKISPRFFYWRLSLLIICTIGITLYFWREGKLFSSMMAIMAALLLLLWLRPFRDIQRQLSSLISHSGVIIFAIGIAFSTVSKQEVSANMTLGHSISLSGYQFTFQQLQLEAQSHYTTEKALITVVQKDKLISTLMPERRFYTARKQLMIEPSMHWGWIRNWYAVLGEKTGNNRYALRFYVQDGVQWIWGGALIMCIGLFWGWIKGRAKHV